MTLTRNKELFKKTEEPFLWGALGPFVYPTTDMYFRKNPIVKNPDKKDYARLYWKGNSRSVISLGAGVIVGTIGLVELVVSELEHMASESDHTRLLISGGIFLGTNLISGTYEIKKKYF